MLETDPGWARSMCRADHTMNCRKQVAARERLGDDLSNAKRCGRGARSEESRPELPGDRDQRRLRVRSLDGAQRAGPFAARHVKVVALEIRLIRNVRIAPLCRAPRRPL